MSDREKDMLRGVDPNDPTSDSGGRVASGDADRPNKSENVDPERWTGGVGPDSWTGDVGPRGKTGGVGLDEWAGCDVDAERRLAGVRIVLRRSG